MIIREEEIWEEIDVVIVGCDRLWTTRGTINVMWYVLFSGILMFF